MFLETVTVSPFMSNCYILGCEDTLKGVIIDPGDEVPRIARRVEGMKLNIEVIVATHGHIDHIGGAADAIKTFDAPFYLHADDFFIAREVVKKALMWGMGPREAPPLENELKEGDTIAAGNLDLRILHTPGHSPGGVCFQIGNLVFTGDTIFEGSVGRTDFEGGNMDTLLSSIREKLLPLPDDTELLPGHGAPTTVGRERMFNPFITGASTI